MELQRLSTAFCALVIGLSISNSARALPVTVTSTLVASRVYFGYPSEVASTFSDTSIPSGDLLTAIHGNTSAITLVSQSGTTNSATFAYDFEHGINIDTDNSYYNVEAQTDVLLYFTADVATHYSIDGYYSMSGPSGTGTYMHALLLDLTEVLDENTPLPLYLGLFDDYSASYRTADEYFLLGTSGDGDYGNRTTGTLTGNLVAGHDYVFSFITSISTWDPYSYNSYSHVSATATGRVVLNITAIPVPGALWLFGGGMLGLAGIASRKPSDAT